MAGSKGVLVRAEIELAQPYASVSERFSSAGSWLGASAGAAEAKAGASLVVGPCGRDGLVARKVAVRVGGVMPRGPGEVLWLQWESADGNTLVPVLDGELELQPVGDSSCRLRFSASYVPPLGALGRALDWAVMHRVAESTTRAFLAELRPFLEPSAGPAAAAGPAAPPEAEVTLPGTIDSPSTARAFVRELAERFGEAIDVDALVLLTGELVTRSVVHAKSAVHLRVCALEDGLVVEVSDEDPTPPTFDASLPGASEASGRGLFLLRHFAEGFGTRALVGGKTVWFRLAWIRAAASPGELLGAVATR